MSDLKLVVVVLVFVAVGTAPVYCVFYRLWNLYWELKAKWAARLVVNLKIGQKPAMGFPMVPEGRLTPSDLNGGVRGELHGGQWVLRIHWGTFDLQLDRFPGIDSGHLVLQFPAEPVFALVVGAGAHVVCRAAADIVDAHEDARIALHQWLRGHGERFPTWSLSHHEARYRSGSSEQGRETLQHVPHQFHGKPFSEPIEVPGCNQAHQTSLKGAEMTESTLSLVPFGGK